ncbi:autotransporter assembly complex family protein [Snodgrassella sp. CFCC 13594]|uniref:autotransporter assembly complex protein TamA n=1 Tax=Snodgrassella sp. CFCC 13594 TaxID=1775559 RepID=UPI00083785D5|nr:autotransporter assembly complex family protein [Snodgrassella sp. CFCC 13594]
MSKSLHLAILATLFSLSTPWALAEDTAPSTDGASTPDDSDTPPKTSLWEKIWPAKPVPVVIKHPVRIDVNDTSIAKIITEHLPLITQQQQEELDTEQIGFLVEEAPDQVQTMLQTQGYFNSKVQISPEGDGFVVTITLGPRTHIDNVSVAIVGDILSDDDLTQYYQNAMANWALPVGDPFTQSNWASSKSSVLTAVVRKKYPLATISASKATIDPNQNQADLSLTVDSKQPIYFGPIEISGAQRYPESVVRGMARFEPGSPYDLDKLLDYQQALEQDSHYGSAVVQADFKGMQDNRVPVKVAVNEMKRQKFELGLRYDSADGAGFRVGYDHYNVFNHGYVGSTLLDTDKYQTTFGFGLSQPRQSNGHFWTSNVSYQRSTAQKLEKKALTSGVWYVRDKNNIDSRLGLEYITESSRITDGGPDLGHSNALMVTASWKRQNIETQLRPANGYYLEGKVGTTLGTLGSSTMIQRVNANAGYYYTPQEKKYGTWVVRGQFGYVHAKDDANVPSSLMFRSGGATSVRGYEQDSIGIAGPNDSVLPDRVLGVASVEYQIPVYKDFAAAIFHDMGSVSHSFSSMKWEHGTGIGVRWFSPVAPFAFDVAYGHHDKKVRWHISLGTRF